MDKIESYDIVILGAGIQGLGIAEQASHLGKSVLIVEKNAKVGRETSANSSKLIHGGLRYLETFQLKLVYECLKERRHLLKEYPELITLRPFLLPIYASNKRPWWMVAIGLSLYAVLGGLKQSNRFSSVPREQWSGLGLCTQGLRKVYRFFDAQTDDAALAQRVCDRAVSFGAKLLCNSNFISAEESPGGYRISLSCGRIIETTTLVNACGPWVNEVASTIQNVVTERVALVQGSHLVLDMPAFLHGSEEVCFYLESPLDQRPFFVLPWRGKVMVGTTETALEEPCAQVKSSEREYLLENFKYYFPNAKVSAKHILIEYCGIRVLPGSDGEASRAGSKTRETRYAYQSSAHRQYLAVYGGKLTSYRLSAKKALSYLKGTSKS